MMTGAGVSGGKRVGEQGTAEPPAENEQRPLEKIFVLGDPQPYPDKICKAVTHRHPEQDPEQAVAVENFPRMADEMKDAVIDDHIDDAENKPDQYGHVFLFEQQQRGKQHEKGGVQPYVQGIELPARNNFGHGMFSLRKYASIILHFAEIVKAGT